MPRVRRGSWGAGIGAVMAAAAIAFVLLLLRPPPEDPGTPVAPVPSGTPSKDRARPREEDAPPAFPARVARALDGDTLLLEGGDRVRLIGIDAPEADHPCYGEACRACRSLVEGREARIEPKAAPSRDPYGRLLAVVLVEGKMINETLLDRGLALVYRKEEGEVPGAVGEAFIAAQNRAIDARRGIWSLPGALLTPPGGLVETRFRFHRRTCSEIGGARLRATDREAALRKGKSPCRTCSP